MLMQPTIEKLHSMKLFGMAEGIRRQTEDPEISRLSFEERLALLVDWQQLHCLCSGSESGSRRLYRALCARTASVSRFGHRACRWQLRQGAGSVCTYRCRDCR